MDLNLNRKTAAIAGATRGIGRAIAELLAAEGCNVSICARDAEAVDGVVADLKASGANAMGQVTDTTDRAAQEAWVNATAQAFGRERFSYGAFFSYRKLLPRIEDLCPG